VDKIDCFKKRKEVLIAAYIVLISSLTLVDFALIFQFFTLFIALPGFAYFVDIFGSILTGLSFLRARATLIE
jgi:hypothetical protein